jgi:hypothetical protein
MINISEDLGAYQHVASVQLDPNKPPVETGVYDGHVVLAQPAIGYDYVSPGRGRRADRPAHRGHGVCKGELNGNGVRRPEPQG